MSQPLPAPDPTLTRRDRLRPSGFFAAAAGLLAAAVLLRPALLQTFSRDGVLHADTLLSLTFLRLFLAGLALIAPFWPHLADTRARRALFLLALLLTFAVRTIRLNTPYLDQHSHRQTDVATIARNFYERDPNILLPQVNWRADGPNYIASTFPLTPWLAGMGYHLFGEQAWVGRLLIALFSLLGVAGVFGLVDLYWGQTAGFLAALFVAMSPLGVYFGRALLDDVPAISLGVAGLWGVGVWLKLGKREGLWLGVPALALALLIKVVTLYLWLPLGLMLWERWRWRVVRERVAWAVLALPLLPSLAWYAWAYQLGRHYLTFGIFGDAASTEPTGYGAYSKWGSLGFVLRDAFARRIGDRVLHQVLTPPGLAALALGLVAAVRRRSAGRWVFAAWVLAVLMFTAATGTAQWYHDYYQLPFTTALAPFVGLGLAAIWRFSARPRQALLPAGQWLALGLTLLLVAFSARMLPYYYNDWQGWILPEAAFVQAQTAPEDKVITVTMEGDTTLLYHLHRPGWVIDLTNQAALATVPRAIAADARIVILQDLEYRQAKTLTDQPWVQGLELLLATEHYRVYRTPQDQGKR